MGEYKLSNDYIELIAGSSNVYSKEYKEAANNVNQNNKIGMGYLKNFIVSIENIANKKETKDKRISDSKGNLKQFVGYDNIKFAIEFIKKNLAGAPGLRDLMSIHDKLIDFQPQYTDAYDKQCRMVILEYESAVYLLVTGLSMLLSNNMEVIQNGSTIKIQKTNESTHGVIEKATKDLAEQLTNKNHKTYLEEILKESDNKIVSTDLNESTTFMENNVVDFLALIDRIGAAIGNTIKGGINIGKTIVKSAFGIIPLIRSIMYLRYKKKADTINTLDEQCAFIKMNIEQLQNRTNMDPNKKAEIIKKQEAVIERYQKKAAKLRAELMEQEKDATTALEKENPELKKTDDDFVLEGVSFMQIFAEDTSNILGITKNNTPIIKNSLVNDPSGNNSQADTDADALKPSLIAIASAVSNNSTTAINQMNQILKDSTITGNSANNVITWITSMNIFLKNENYIIDKLDFKTTPAEFINNIKSLKSFSDYSLTIDQSWFDNAVDYRISTFAEILMNHWNGYRLIDIDFFGESYTLAIIPSGSFDTVVQNCQNILNWKYKYPSIWNQSYEKYLNDLD